MAFCPLQNPNNLSRKARFAYLMLPVSCLTSNTPSMPTSATRFETAFCGKVLPVPQVTE